MSPSVRAPCSSDEMFFYREDGLYRYYNISANGWDSISSLSLG